MGSEGVSVCLGVRVRACDRYLALFLCVGACHRLRDSLFLQYLSVINGVVLVCACVHVITSYLYSGMCCAFCSFCNCRFHIRVSPSPYVIDCVLAILIDVEIRCESLPQDQ